MNYVYKMCNGWIFMNKERIIQRELEYVQKIRMFEDRKREHENNLSNVSSSRIQLSDEEFKREIEIHKRYMDVLRFELDREKLLLSILHASKNKKSTTGMEGRG